MTAAELLSLIKDASVGGMALALFFRLGKIVADHEIRITTLERHKTRGYAKKRGA